MTRIIPAAVFGTIFAAAVVFVVNVPKLASPAPEAKTEASAPAATPSPALGESKSTQDNEVPAAAAAKAQAESSGVTFPEFPKRPPTLLIHYISDILNRLPLVDTLFILILIDIFMGTAAAFVNKKLSSNASWRGMTKKSGSILILGMVAAVEPLTGLPLAKLVSLYYIWTEAISIVEAAAALGVPLPPQLLSALLKLRENDKIDLPGQAPAAPTAVQVIVKGQASIKPGGNASRIDISGGGESPERTAAINANTAAMAENTAARMGANERTDAAVARDRDLEAEPESVS